MLALDAHRLDQLTAVAIASVVPPLTERFVEFAHERLGLEPMVVDAATLRASCRSRSTGRPRPGADRLCNALAAGIEVGGPAIVIDLGTSTNFDVIDANGAYLGGAIAPGLGALAGGAGRRGPASCRGSSCGGPTHAIGANTIDAMQSGAVLGYIGLVSGLLTALRGELIERSPAGSRVTVIATGGYTHEPWLTRRAGHRSRGAGPHPARHPLRLGAHHRRA